MHKFQIVIKLFPQCKKKNKKTEKELCVREISEVVKIQLYI